MARKVILLTGHNVTRPLWAALAQQYDLAFTAPGLAAEAVGMGLQGVIDLQTVVSAETIEMADRAAASLIAQVVNATPRIRAVFAGAYPEGVAPHTLAQGAGEWFPGFWLSQTTRLMTNLATIDALAQAREVAACVVHEDVSPEYRALVLYCRAHGIQTIHLPHAPCHLLPGVVDIHRETCTDWILASGEGMRKFYTESGFDPARIITVGAPQWDGFYSASMPSRESARTVVGIDTLGIDAGTPVICYASSWSQTTSLRSGFSRELTAGFTGALTLAKQSKGALIVKTHPNEAANEKWYFEMLKQNEVPGFVTRDHLPYVLRSADVMIAQGPSNLCIQAAILGLPSAYIQTEGFDYAHPLPFRAPAGNTQALGAACNQALESRGAAEWDDFVGYYNAAHGERGGAGDRAAEVVAGIAG